jgi:hypothetical protein
MVHFSLDTNHVEMGEQQKRFGLAVALDPRDEIPTRRFERDDLGRDALLIQNAFQVLRGFGFVARRIAGVNADQSLKDLNGFVSRLVEVRVSGRLWFCARCGSGAHEENCKQSLSHGSSDAPLPLGEGDARRRVRV